jgi:hypothetical protein
MLHNDLTFEVPQTDSQIRAFLDSCHRAEADTQLAAKEKDEASLANGAGTGTPTPSEDQSAEPPSSNSGSEPTVQRNEDGSFDLFGNRN